MNIAIFAYSRTGCKTARRICMALPEAENRLARMVREALRVCPYITSVERFSFTREKSGLKAAFTVKTVYGALTAESEVTL